MENENNEILDSQNEENADSDASTEETTEDYKSKVIDLEEKNRQLFARAKKAEGFDQDADGNWIKTIIKEKTESKKFEKSSSLDYGQLAYLKANNIESDEDISFVEEESEKSGLELKDLLKNEYFQAKLAKRQKEIEVKEATPIGTRRSTSAPRDSVEYWNKKGELPGWDQRELRIKVVNSRMKKDNPSEMFTDNPLGGMTSTKK